MRKITMKAVKSGNENGASVDTSLREGSEEPDQEYSESDSKSDNQSEAEGPSNSDTKTKSKKENGKSKSKGKPGKKTKAKKNASEEGEGEYEVGKIVGKQTFSGKVHFLIRWKGYTAKDDTWEAEDTLNCDDLIKKYLKAEKKSQVNRKTVPRRAQRVDYQEEDEDDFVYESSRARPKKRAAPAAKKSKEYEVDKILDSEMKNGKRQFLVSWKGYPESQATWEPENNLNCRDLLDKYLDNEGEEETDNDNKKTAKGGKDKKRGAAADKDPEDYEVDKILDTEMKNGKRQFLVSWKGYPESEATWEPEANLDCQDLIDAFLGDEAEDEDDEDDEPVGKKVKASKRAAKGKKSKRKA